MCALFGLYDYGNNLTATMKTKLIRSLGQASEVRGTDASGISYVHDNRLIIYKRPLSARKMNFRVSESTICVMGHTRMTTQGDEHINRNNHPFRGNCGDISFSVAHNGVIFNDSKLRRDLKLPETDIETDSYIAVQMLEREEKLNADSLSRVSEKLEGSFTLSVIDERNRLYLIKGNNPLSVCRIPTLGVYVYASTNDILTEALTKCRLDRYKHEKMPIEQGEIVMIDTSGRVTHSSFDDSRIRRSSIYTYRSYTEMSYIEEAMWYACSEGMDEDTFTSLTEMGYTPDEILDMLYDHEFYNDCISDLFM